MNKQYIDETREVTLWGTTDAVAHIKGWYSPGTYETPPEEDIEVTYTLPFGFSTQLNKEFFI
jgi:hypothetical protein